MANDVKLSVQHSLKGHLTPLKSPASLGLMRERHKSGREGGRGEVCGTERREGGDGVARTEMRGCDEKMGGKGRRGGGGVEHCVKENQK